MHKGEIQLYQTSQGTEIEVRLYEDTLWLTQKQIAEVFGTEVPAISKHIKNIVNSGELEAEGTISKMETVQQEGARTIRRKVDAYNLDMVISVGYRVNSNRATQFRIWATQRLKDYLVKGYSINQKRLEELECQVERSRDLITRIFLLLFLDSARSDKRNIPMLKNNFRYRFVS